MLGPVEPGEVLVPSPLLTRVPPFVRLHFEIGPDGRVTSPQAPDGNLRDLAESEYVAADDVIAAEALRLMLAELLDTGVDGQIAAGASIETFIDADRLARQETAAAAQLAEAPMQQRAPTITPQTDSIADGGREFAQLGDSPRAQQPQDDAANRVPEPRSRQAPASKTAVEQPEVVLGPLSASWLGGEELVLMREVRVGQTTLRQGVWLDWPSLRQWLLAQVGDLVPGATLRAGAAEARSLAVIPAVIQWPEGGSVRAELASPLGVVLVLTWAAALLAVVAIGVVLRLATSLAERRGRFVSAVTHELRTPMTSVRLYADLLASDAARDGERRDRFVGTLREESARLARIIENVLAYARLGRANGNGHGDSRRPTVGELVEQAVGEQALALANSGLTLCQRLGDGIDALVLDVDGDAAVRILGNLIENACKYGHSTDRAEVEVAAHRVGGMVHLNVRDWGPGVPRRDQRRIFDAFHRAQRDELRENGLGLGLALGRGLARQMGGSLVLDEVERGACFTLSLPIVNGK
jgi:signal transduction histidine kinase